MVVDTAAMKDEATIREQENEKRRWVYRIASGSKSFVPWVISLVLILVSTTPNISNLCFFSVSPLSSLPYPIPFAIHFSTIFSLFIPFFVCFGKKIRREYCSKLLFVCWFVPPQMKWRRKRFQICSRMLERKWKQAGRCGYRRTHHTYTPVFFRLVDVMCTVMLLFSPVCEAMQRRSVWSIRSLGCLCWWWRSRKHWWRRSFVWSENTRSLITAISQLMRLDSCFPLVRGCLTKERIMACESGRI